jgi:hypothetical protein
MVPLYLSVDSHAAMSVTQDIFVSMHKWPTFYGVFGAAFDIDAWSFWGGEDQVFFCANPGDDQGYGFTGWSHQMWNMWYVSRGEAASLCKALWSSLIPTGYGQKWCRWLRQAILCHRGVLRGWRGRLQSFRGYTGVAFLPYVEPRFLQSWYDESISRGRRSVMLLLLLLLLPLKHCGEFATAPPQYWAAGDSCFLSSPAGMNMAAPGPDAQFYYLGQYKHVPICFYSLYCSECRLAVRFNSGLTFWNQTLSSTRSASLVHHASD